MVYTDPQYKLWRIDEDDIPVYLPAEIFKDFQVPQLRTIRQQAYALSFYYLFSYLYRNTKYTGNDYTPFYMINLAKALNLRYNTVSPIIKRGGILDTLGYTETTQHYPYDVEVDEESGFLDFVTYADVKDACHSMTFLEPSERKKILDLEPSIFFKKPVKAFFRDKGAKDHENYNGHFYDYFDCFKVDISDFIYCINQKDLGVVGFYIYCYLKSFYDKGTNGGKNPKGFKGTYKRSIETYLKISNLSVQKYVKLLHEHNLITVVPSKKRFMYSVPASLSKIKK